MEIDNNMVFENIKSCTEYLKLPSVRKHFIEEAKEAVTDNIDYEEYLRRLLQRETDVRLEHAKQKRIHQANFTFKKYLEDIIVEELPADAQKKFKTLKTLDFIDKGQNVILAGNPGTGKTHLSIGLGLKACMSGYRVLFTTIPLLITQLKESRSEKNLRSFEHKFENYDLVITDELGYISFDKEGSELLFTCLSLRASRKSTIITTNLSFERWDEIFQDPVMTAAMIDRMTHKAYIVNMNGNSFRLKETETWIQEEENDKDGGDKND
jgi:DNA replication protein DnaC